MGLSVSWIYKVTLNQHQKLIISAKHESPSINPLVQCTRPSLRATPALWTTIALRQGRGSALNGKREEMAHGVVGPRGRYYPISYWHRYLVWEVKTNRLLSILPKLNAFRLSDSEGQNIHDGRFLYLIIPIWHLLSSWKVFVLQFY